MNQRGVALTSRAVVTASPRLVGRQEELWTLASGVVASPRLILLGGEAGVGKTRLVQELFAHPAVAGRQRLIGFCQPVQEPFPLGPMVQALSGFAGDLGLLGSLNPVIGALRPLLPEFAGWLPPPLPPTYDPRADRYRVLRGVAALLSAIGPAVVVVEDAHWIDSHTYELLLELAGQLPRQLTLVVTYRIEDAAAAGRITALARALPERNQLGELALAPLSPAEVRVLATDFLGVPEIPQPLAIELHERTMGVPFAVEEMLRLLRQSQVNNFGPDRAAASRTLNALGVPALVRDSALQRLARLPADAAVVIRAASVLDMPVDEELLASMCAFSPQRVAGALSDAVDSALLFASEHGRYGFRHALARQAVYESLNAAQRRIMHSRAAEAIAAAAGDATPAWGLLAHHYRQAGQQAGWVRCAEAAADTATKLGDDAAATQFLRSALDAPGVPPTIRARIAVKLGKAALVGLSYAEVTEVLRRILTEERLPAGVRGELRLDLGLMIFNQANEVRAGLTQIEQATADLRQRPALAARAYCTLALPAGTAHVSSHLHWLAEADRLAARIRDPEMRLAVAGNRATTLLMIGDSRGWDVVRELPYDAVAPAQRRQLLRAACNIAHAAMHLGYYRRAQWFLRQAERLAGDTDAGYLSSISATTRLWLDFARGLWNGLAERAQQLGQELADLAQPVAEARTVLGLLMLARGNLVAAETQLRQVLGPDLDNTVLTTSAAAAAGLVRLAGYTSSEPADLTGQVVAAIRRKEIWIWAAELAADTIKVLAQTGDHANTAGALVAEMEASVTGRDSPLAVAALTSAQAHLAEAQRRPHDAATGFASAHGKYARLLRPYASAQAAEDSGRCLIAADDPHAAKAWLRTALSTYDILGAAWDAARCRALLHTIGVSVTHRRGPVGYGSCLSPREREVAELAGTGMTNRQIAAALILSPRTVELHVGSILRKLGVSTRQAIAAALQAADG